jgi:hypothetical protein
MMLNKEQINAWRKWLLSDRDNRIADLMQVFNQAELAIDFRDVCLAILDRHNYQGTGEPWPSLFETVRAALAKADTIGKTQ